MKEKLESLVKVLIQAKREDDWWDFKREHHHDKADLVHDIICMANSRENRDCYIIFGVEDKTFSVCGVEDGKDSNRRNQQQITDILRSVDFVGNVRPRIEMMTVNIEKHEVDILVVKNSYDVPYYLNKDY